jgi:hypothetical protein
MKKSILVYTFLCLSFAACDDDESCSAATEANAGPDQIVLGTTATLAANAPESGTGTWAVASGTDGSFGDTSSPTSTFAGTAGSTYELAWTISGCPESSDTVEVAFIAVNSAGFGISKTNVIAGEIINVYSATTPFSPNYQGMAQVFWTKSGQTGIFPDMSFTANMATVMVYATNGGEPGSYVLAQGKRTSTATTMTPMDITVTISSPSPGQFYTSSALSAANAAKGSNVFIGVKNGSATLSDYSIALVASNFETGNPSRYNAALVSFEGGAFGGMDKITFTIPNDIPVNTYRVEVTEMKLGKTMIAGWNGSLNVQ